MGYMFSFMTGASFALCYTDDKRWLLLLLIGVVGCAVSHFTDERQ
jgi:uncharacterized membrane protein